MDTAMNRPLVRTADTAILCIVLQYGYMNSDLQLTFSSKGN